MSATERTFSFVLCASLVTTFTLDAQTANRSPDRLAPVVSRIDGSIVLDGRITERAWERLEPLPVTMYLPMHGGALTEATDIRVAYDDTHLYIAARMYDSDPSAIRVNSMYRDRTRGDDTFGVVIDPYDDNDIGLWFWTTPAGIRGDAEITGDGQGGTNSDWNTFWDVATHRDDRGWYAEMRIPFSSLGFQSDGVVVRMGLTASRYIARKNERHVFPDIATEFNYLRPSLAFDIELTGIRARRPVFVTPYVVSGVGQNAELATSGAEYEMVNTVPREIGLDVKYNLTSNLTLDLTANTDFAQAEADNQQVNLTRYPLFFPEKRQFFQERSGIFNFFTGGSSRLFHSRRIGLQDGDAVRILGGARLVGRMGEWDVGVLNLQAASQRGRPSENFGVARVRRRVLNEHSNAGAMLTTRVDGDGAYNVAYGVDGSFRVFGDDYLTLRWAQTVDDAFVDSTGFQFLPAGRFRVTWNRARSRGFTYFVSGRWSGPDYQPDLGFVNRRDFSEVFYYIAYFHYPQGDGPFRRIDPFQLFGNVVWRNEDESVESAFVEHDFDLQWKSGASLGLDLELHYDDLRDVLLLPNASTVPVGQYWQPRFEFDYNMRPGARARASFGGGVQKFYDGWMANVWAGPQWTVSRHLTLNPTYTVNVGRFSQRDQGFDSHIVRLRTQAAVNTKLSLNGFIQLSNANHFTAANLRFRYNIQEGNDLWVVYNHGWNLDRDRVDPALPLTDNRTVLVKYTHTFRR